MATSEERAPRECSTLDDEDLSAPLLEPLSSQHPDSSSGLFSSGLLSLNAEILKIAVPMLAALATDPITGLVDTAFVGRIGAVELAGMAIALSIFNTLARCLNIPLVSATTTAVAEACGLAKVARHHATENEVHDTDGITAASAVDCTAASMSSEALSPASTIARSSQPIDIVCNFWEKPWWSQGNTPVAGSPVLVMGSSPWDLENGLASSNPVEFKTPSLMRISKSLPDIPSMHDAEDDILKGETVLSKPSTAIVRLPKSTKALPPDEGQERQETTSAPIISRGHVLDRADVAGAASAAVAMGIVLGTLEAILIAMAAGWVVRVWGLPAGSPAHQYAMDFLLVRAWTTPFTVILLVLQGVFRGLADTTTPFMASLSANIINIVLAPIFIFVLGWGVKGAAAAQGIAQVVPTLLLLFTLVRKLNVGWVTPAALGHLVALLKPSGLLLLRTISVTATYAVATSTSAHLGADYAAAQHISMSMWLPTSLLADAIAVAAQSLIARYAAEGRQMLACAVADRCISMGGVLGIVMGGVLALFRDYAPHIFTNDNVVLGIVNVIMPVLIVTQPINMLAFVYDGVLFGVGGFRYASLAMVFCAGCCLSVISTGRTVATQDPTSTILWVWAGLTMLMLTRCLTIHVPYQLRWGPFGALKVTRATNLS